MSVQPLLCVRSRGASNPQLAVLDQSGAQPVAIGSTFGAVDYSDNTDARGNNRALRWHGYTYVIQGGAIYRTPDGSTTPTLVYTFASAMQNPGAHLGLYARLIDGVSTLVTAYGVVSSTTWKVVRSTDGTSWSENSVTNVVNMSSANVGRVGVWRNRLFFATNNADVGNSSAAIDVENLVVTKQTGGSLFITSDFCVYGGLIYQLKGNGNASGYTVYVLNGSTWEARGTAMAATRDSVPTADSLLFADGAGNMVAMLVGQVPSGPVLMSAHRLVVDGNGAITCTDISTTVLPVSLSTTGGVVALTETMACYQELDSTSGAVTTHLYFAHGNHPNSQAWNYYVWNDITTPIGMGGSANDSGGDVAYALPHTKTGSFDGGTSYVYDATLPEVWWAADPAQVLLGEEHYFTLSAPGGVMKNFREWYATTGDYRNATRATFKSCRRVSGTGAIPTLSNDKLTVQGCTGDGSTVYAATWDTVVDAIDPLERVTSIGEVV